MYDHIHIYIRTMEKRSDMKKNKKTKLKEVEKWKNLSEKRIDRPTYPQ